MRQRLFPQHPSTVDQMVAQLEKAKVKIIHIVPGPNAHAVVDIPASETSPLRFPTVGRVEPADSSDRDRGE